MLSGLGVSAWRIEMSEPRVEATHGVSAVRGGYGRLAMRRTAIAALSLVAILGGTVTSIDGGRPAAAASPVAARIGSAPHVGDAVALGRMPGTSLLGVDVSLRPRDPAALTEYAAEVSTPGSSLFRHYLSRGEFAARFGPTADAIAAVQSGLRSDGLAVSSISADHLTVHVRGTVAAIEHAFSTGIEQYRLAGRVTYANTAAPRLDASASPYVQGIFGLDDLTAAEPLDETSRVPATVQRPLAAHVVTGGPQPCAAAVTAGSQKHVYTSDQLAAAYEFSGLYSAGDEGAGVTIGLFELGPNLPGDITKFQVCYGTSASVTYTQVDGGAGTGAGDGEAPLDIETAIGLAPKAHFAVYQAPRTQAGIIDDFTAMIDGDTAKVITSSWGECEKNNGSTLIAAEGTLFEQAAAQGQSVLAASGDYGASDCQNNMLTVDDPASQPFVTGVGGTTLSAIGPAPTEKAWNDSSIRTGAGGGGVSSSQTMPWYQATAPAALRVIGADSSGSLCKAAAGTYCREVPDVSADADRSTGYLIYYNGGWAPNGGTSAASPLWAALLALADASATCGGRSIGFANPALYAAAATTYSADFNDVTTGNNDYTPYGNTTGLYPAGVGYNMATGLGTPKAASLAAALCAGSAVTSVPTTSALSRATGTLTYGAESRQGFSIAVSGSAGDGQPLGVAHVFGRTTLLCSSVLTPQSGDRSTGSCRLSATELAAGPHADVFVVYSPSVKSSTDTQVRFTASKSSGAVSFRVIKDRTTVTVHLSQATVRDGDESTVKFSATVRTRFGEPVLAGGRATVHVGGASCAIKLERGKGTCTLGNRALPVGSDEVTVVYLGDADLTRAGGAAASRLTVTST